MITDIKKCLNKHTKLSFPDAKGSTKLAEWLTDLSELDGYFVGIAQSIIKGKLIKDPIEYDSLRTLRLNLQILSETADVDTETYSVCDDYLTSLENLAKAIKSKK